MKCLYCGNELNEGIKFCTKCGAEVARMIQNSGHICPKCGEQFARDTKFCGRCGTPLVERAAPNTTYMEQPDKKKDIRIIMAIATLLSVLLCSFGIVGYLYYQNESKEMDKFNEAIKVENNGKATDTTDKESYNEKDEDSEDDYLFPSDKKYITESDLYGKSKDDVALIRNEIYARHGYIFGSEYYKAYFESKDWYVPNENFSSDMLNKIEKSNSEFIVMYEEDRGWR